MRLIDVRVRNFRSIAEEQIIPVGSGVTIVGPNNSGKTNILRAVQMLFTGHDNKFRYSRERDLYHKAGKERTTITVRFEGDPHGAEKWFFDDLDQLHKLQGTKRISNDATLHLYFSETDTPVYNFFPNVKRPTERKKAVRYSSIARRLVSRFLDGFAVHYVPSDKSVEALYRDLVTPFLRDSLATVLDAHRSALQDKLDEAGKHVSKEMGAAGCGGIEAKFAVPDGSVASLLSHFDFNLSDPLPTPYLQKGMGIQAASIFAAMTWITNQETSRDKSVIWLLEEPESYLHPALSAACSRLLLQLGATASVLRTTHSLSFVPTDPKAVRGAERQGDKTVVVTYKTSFEAGASIRQALGVKFGDYYGLSEYSVFVEGPSDREILLWFLSKVDVSSYPTVRRAGIQDFGGVKHLSGFLRATYSLFCKEVASVSIFDGDDAGAKERKDLQQYFGQKKIPFRANEEFVSVRDRFAIEGLFPDEWIVAIHSRRPAWFETYSVDVAGNLEPFRVKDERKAELIRVLKGVADDQPDQKWASRFVQVMDAIEAALIRQGKKLGF